MRGYRFRLESVLRVRRVQEERAKAELAMARLAEIEARGRTSRRRAALERALDLGLPNGPSRSWMAEHERHERLASAVTASQLAEIHAADLSLMRLRDWEQAATDLHTLEKLDDRSREQWRAEQLAEEQKALDELANARRRDDGTEREEPT